MEIKSRVRDLSSQLKWKDESHANTPQKVRDRAKGKRPAKDMTNTPEKNKAKKTAKSTGLGSEI